MEIILIAKYSIPFFIFKDNMNIYICIFYNIMISRHNKNERGQKASPVFCLH